MLLAGIAITFAAVPFVDLVFTTFGFAFAELVALSGFDVLVIV